MVQPALARAGENALGYHLIYERYIWFDRQIRAGCYPNASTLARQFELSSKTAQRNIEFFLLCLGATQPWCRGPLSPATLV